MANVLEHVRYVMSNVDNNNNKFWYGTLYDDGSYMAEFGRVGAKINQCHKPYGDNSKAKREFEKKCREKEGKGYRKLDVLNGATDGKGAVSQTVVKKQSVADIALRQIDSSTDKETKDLIRYFSKVNAHNICSATTMEYDIDSGLFSTPCGIVTQATVDEANKLLVDMSDLVANRKHDNRQFKDMACSYLMLIPQKVGRKLDLREVFPDLNAVQRQKAILDALEASIQSVTSGINSDSKKDKKDNAPEAKIFSVKLERLSDKSDIERIRKKYKKTLHRNHSCAHMDLKRVWTVDIATMKDAFEGRGKKIGNIHEYWHGTRASNILSILKGGLIIPPSNASNVTGRMFGNGVYFSSESTKSLNYSYGYWGGGRDNNPFMFLADVAMGKYYVPSSSGYGFPKKGYDSTWAKAGTCVMNHEMIVYDVSQCNLTYLVEFE